MKKNETVHNSEGKPSAFPLQLTKPLTTEREVFIASKGVPAVLASLLNKGWPEAERLRSDRGADAQAGLLLRCLKETETPAEGVALFKSASGFNASALRQALEKIDVWTLSPPPKGSAAFASASGPKIALLDSPESASAPATLDAKALGL